MLCEAFSSPGSILCRRLRTYLSIHANTASAVFAGHDASRALGMMSTKAEDVRPEWDDLPESEKKTLNDWEIFYSKRYNIIGMVEGAKNLG